VQIMSLIVGLATLVTLVWTRYDAVRAAAKAEEAANHAMDHAVVASQGIHDVAGVLDHLVLNTNGMSQRLEQLAGQAGEARGRAEAIKDSSDV